MIARAVTLAVVSLAAGCGDGGGSSDPAEMLAPHPPPVLRAERVFSALAFTQPVAMLQAPGDATRWFVVEKAGIVRVFFNTPAVAAAAVFADIRGRATNVEDMGLLGMAFHPDFPTNPRVYLAYVNETGADRFSRVSEFQLDASGDLDPATEVILLRVRQPDRNHTVGHLAFGPDGFLYIGIGDGGGANDQHGAIGNGQLTTTLLGKMLRINVTPGAYAIPNDNPFFGNAPCGQPPAEGTGAADCPEIFAWGFRNPWRWSFDRVGGALWVGDVGQSALDEIDRVVVGGNYGWRCREGTLATGMACGAAANLLPPVAEYTRGLGSSVTGGYVYRGAAVAGLAGRYVLGDFIRGTLWHIAAGTQPTLRIGAGFSTGLNIVSFGQDVAGELYIVDFAGGIYALR